MNCPKCEKGEIRVITAIRVSCGHPLYCPECRSFYEMAGRLGKPGEIKLPPEHQMRSSLAFNISFGRRGRLFYLFLRLGSKPVEKVRARLAAAG